MAHTLTEAARVQNLRTINGKTWVLYSRHSTKREAEDRARTVRKVYGKARVFVIPKWTADVENKQRKLIGYRPMEYRKYGVYKPVN